MNLKCPDCSNIVFVNLENKIIQCTRCGYKKSKPTLKIRELEIEN